MTTRPYFARLLKTDQVQTCLNMLEDAAGGPLGALMTGSIKGEFIKVCAPDGDEVFSALRKGNEDAWICRLHKEVFTE